MGYSYSWFYYFQILLRQGTIFSTAPLFDLHSFDCLVFGTKLVFMKENKNVWYYYWLHNNETFENCRNTYKIINYIILKLNNSKHKHQQFEFWSSIYCIFQRICSRIIGNIGQLNYPCMDASCGFAGDRLQEGFQLMTQWGRNPAYTLLGKLWAQTYDYICPEVVAHFSN